MIGLSVDVLFGGSEPFFFNDYFVMYTYVIFYFIFFIKPPQVEKIRYIHSIHSKISR